MGRKGLLLARLRRKLDQACACGLDYEFEAEHCFDLERERLQQAAAEQALLHTSIAALYARLAAGEGQDR